MILYVCILWFAHPVESGSSDECLALVFAVSTGYVLVHVTIAFKVWRIWTFVKEPFRKVKVSNGDVAKRVGAVLLAVYVYLFVVRAVVGKPSPRRWSTDSSEDEFVWRCEGRYLRPYAGVLAIFAVGTLLATFMAYQTRSVSTLFNESADVSLSAYNLFLAVSYSGIALTVARVYATTLVAVEAFVVFYTTTVTLGLLSAKKIKLLRSSGDEVARLLAQLAKTKKEEFRTEAVLLPDAEAIASCFDGAEKTHTPRDKHGSVCLHDYNEGSAVTLLDTTRTGMRYRVPDGEPLPPVVQGRVDGCLSALESRLERGDISGFKSAVRTLARTMAVVETSAEFNSRLDESHVNKVIENVRSATMSTLDTTTPRPRTPSTPERALRSLKRVFSAKMSYSNRNLDDNLSLSRTNDDVSGVALAAVAGGRLSEGSGGDGASSRESSLNDVGAATRGVERARSIRFSPSLEVVVASPPASVRSASQWGSEWGSQSKLEGAEHAAEDDVEDAPPRYDSPTPRPSLEAGFSEENVPMLEAPTVEEAPPSDDQKAGTALRHTEVLGNQRADRARN